MTAFVWAYITLFAVGHLVLVLWERRLSPAERDPPGETARDVVVAALLLLGMLGFQLGVNGPALRHAWKLVSIGLLIFLGVDNLRARRRTVEAEGVSRPAVALADIVALSLLAPAVAINIAWAFTKG